MIVHQIPVGPMQNFSYIVVDEDTTAPATAFRTHSSICIYRALLRALLLIPCFEYVS